MAITRGDRMVRPSPTVGAALPRLLGDDTSPDAERYLVAAYRRMSGQEKIARVRALNRTMTRLALADIRRRHPDADEREVLLRLASRRIGPELVRQLLGWDVQQEGY